MRLPGDGSQQEELGFRPCSVSFRSERFLILEIKPRLAFRHDHKRGIMIHICLKKQDEIGARAKNAEYRRAKVSNETFEFLMYYLAEYRKLLQHQQLLFINIAGEDAVKAWDVDAVCSMFRRMENKTGINGRAAG